MDERGKHELLRAFEPILRFNSGERFFPMDVATFVRDASLWVRTRKDVSRCIVSAGQLTLDALGEHSATDDRDVLFLRAAAPMSPGELARAALRDKRHREDPRDAFRAGRGRLTHVGYTSRIVDALFSVSLLARGRVPGDLAAAAAATYRGEMGRTPVYRYCGRVVEQGDWTVLQYWYFYSFNDWRSKFFGTNDHEGDWEMISVFLSTGGPEGPRPEWVVCSCHEYEGVNLRRRWDDPELETRDNHPVIYVGAGSHAHYYARGDYLAAVRIPILEPLVRATRVLQNLWRDRLRQYMPGEPDADREREGATFSVPFVDYARGDGYAVGHGEELRWSEPEVISPPPPWVRDYRGLWGYYANDPMAGEDAPAGPMYDRDGTVRLAWQDPVAWCGLSSTPPVDRLPAVAERRRDETVQRRRERRNRVDELRGALLALGVEAQSLQVRPHARARTRELSEREAALEQELTEELDGLAADDDTIAALDDEIGRVGDGWTAPARTHINRALRPISPERLRAGRLAGIWAALSVGVMLLALVALAVFAQEHLIYGSAVVLGWYVVIESLFRNRLTQLVTVVTVSLAVVCAVILIIEFYRPMAIALAVGIGVFLLWENIRELWA